MSRHNEKTLRVLDYISKTDTPRNSRLRISQRLMNLTCQIPTEFQRSTRSLGEMSKWKATENRMFLCSSGMVVLKDILPIDVYKHFLLLSISCRILSCKELCIKYLKHAKTYLKQFVLLSEKLYGAESVVLNLHSLSHISDDVENLKCPLSEISAFDFENALGKIKKNIRSGKRPLSQVCRRLQRYFMYCKKQETINASSEAIKPKKM